MTTAIEQAKREMYMTLSSLTQLTNKAELGALNIEQSATSEMQLFQSKLETYLEQLRQQYEEMASTARQRFESIQSLESVNQDLIEQLAKMTESRDMFRNLHQAATHASIERAGQASTSGQTSGDLASCDAADGWNGEGLPPVGAACERNSESGEWVLTKILAHSHLGFVAAYEDVFSPYHLGWCKRESDFRPIRTPEQIAAEERENAVAQMIDDTNILTGIMSDRRVMARQLYDAGYRKQEKPSCQHSFFAIGDDKMKCTFCGVGK